MNKGKSQVKTGTSARPATVAPEVGTAGTPNPPRLFRATDWLAFLLSTVVVLAGYWATLAPDLTLEDSGELAVASMYAGVPHPPGYPAWTLYTWLFANLIPFSNIAWRVALASAVAGALSAGMLAMVVSRGSSMMVESIPSLKGISRGWENAICVVSGFVASCVLAFSSYIWSQAVIVEVYVPSVLSVVGVIICLFRWNYAPHQRRYLYLAFFIFGICFTNHQTLILAAMGIEVAIAAANTRLGRSLFLWNTAVYLMGLVLRAQKLIFVETNPMFFVFFNLVGIASIAAYVFFAIKANESSPEYLRDALLILLFVFAGLIPKMGAGAVLLCLGCLAWCVWVGWKTRNQGGSELLVVLLCGICWVLGASFYLFMPISGMTNPPMQWGYPRIVEGFVHALTRGQYEKTAPADVFGDPLRLVGQLGLLFDNASAEFSYVFLFIAIVPFLFIAAMQRRERAWIIGLTAIYLCLGVLLIFILNPSPDTIDRAGRGLMRPFFTSSHVPIALLVGYGTSLMMAFMCSHYAQFRRWGIIGGLAAIPLAWISLWKWVGETIYGEGLDLSWAQVFAGIRIAFEPDQFALPIFGGLLLVGMCVLFVAGLLLYRNRAPLALSLGIFSLLPGVLVLNNWADSEQRGHLFGYWFGHDMFTPPFTDSNGNFGYNREERARLLQDPEKAPLIYPEMTKDTILFGGTDPGRFCPTYMIFCESFIPDDCKRNPEFDRRDVYIITQNALADGTYLHYIRAHYNKSEQRKFDTPFFQQALRSEKERTNDYHTNIVARIAHQVLDKPLLALGEKIEADRRERGVYPPKEIYIPTPRDSQLCFEQYLADAQVRLQQGRLKPGEDVKVIGGKVQVSGQVAVMAINGLLTKVIFDHNPDHEFFVEESFPLDWMYPHLTPFGIIMKINREPLPDLSEEILARDHEFWAKFSERLIGNWITYDTSVKEITDFARRTYLQHNLAGFQGDRRFVRDDQAQKAFSKLRSSIAGVYAWRLGPECAQYFPQYAPKTPEARARLMKEADFAFRQALAFCPYSPEAVFRYIQLLMQQNRLEDALLIAKTCSELDRYNTQMAGLVRQLENIPAQQAQITRAQQDLSKLEQQWRASPTNLQLGLALASGLVQMQQTSAALTALDRVIAATNLDVTTVLAAAQLYLQLGNMPRLETCLEKLTVIQPESPEGWYDLAAIKAALNKPDEVMAPLTRAIELSQARRASDPNGRDLRAEARKDPRFAALQGREEFKTLVAP
jgi:tetratricopeptide (TPR) repeat protein